MAKNRGLIKVGSYLLLSIGIIVSLLLLGLGLFLFFSYPESSFQKKAVIAGFFIVLAVIVILLTIAAFESMLKLLEVEREVEELEEEIEKK